MAPRGAFSSASPVADPLLGIAEGDRARTGASPGGAAGRAGEAYLPRTESGMRRLGDERDG